MIVCFRDVKDDYKALVGGQGLTHYRILIKYNSKFSRKIEHLSVGLKFRQAARVMLFTKERSGLARIGACSNPIVSNYARIACKVNLQKVYEPLDEVWTFSAALNMSTHTSMSYFDIRARLHLNEYGLVNVHLLAVSVYDWHTAELIFDTSVKVIDLLSPS